MTTLSEEHSESPAREGMVGWLRRDWHWLYLLLLLPLLAVLAFNIFRPVTVLPRIMLAPGYSLTNAEGQLVTSEQFRGRLTLYSFTHTECGEGCYISGEQVADLRQELAPHLPAGADLTFVTISVDPEGDSQEKIAAFQADMEENRPAELPWEWLTGSPERVRAVVGSGFALYYRADEETGSIHIDPRYYLVDGWGIVRAEYRGVEPDIDIVAEDVGLLVEEVANSDGALSLAYEAAHLFSCYPRR